MSQQLVARIQAREIERLQDAKRRALALADERSKENVDLRAEIERLSARLVESDRIADGYYREMRRGSDLVEQKMAEIERLRSTLQYVKKTLEGADTGIYDPVLDPIWQTVRDVLAHKYQE